MGDHTRQNKETLFRYVRHYLFLPLLRCTQSCNYSRRGKYAIFTTTFNPARIFLFILMCHSKTKSLIFLNVERLFTLATKAYKTNHEKRIFIATQRMTKIIKFRWTYTFAKVVFESSFSKK